MFSRLIAKLRAKLQKSPKKIVVEDKSVVKLSFIGGNQSLLSARLIQPFTQTENKNVFESWIFNYANKKAKRVLIDIKERRLYLFTQAIGKRLDRMWILPDDPEKWDEFIYDSIFPEYAI